MTKKKVYKGSIKKKEKLFMKPGRDNKEDRMNFVKYWANYIRTHSDAEWSAQQNFLINSQYPNLKD